MYEILVRRSMAEAPRTTWLRRSDSSSPGASCPGGHSEPELHRIALTLQWLASERRPREMREATSTLCGIRASGTAHRSRRPGQTFAPSCHHGAVSPVPGG